jgi:flavin-dependent dehydrogenase
MAEVAIAGAGVAGASAAIHLGRAGYRVTLIDRATFPRDKACGEGLMPSGVAALRRLGLESLVAAGEPFYGIRYHAGQATATGRFPTVIGYPDHGVGQRRLALDQQLLDVARATPGVTVIEGTRVDGPLLEAGRVVGLNADGKAYTAALTIAADGLHSPLRRALNLDRPTPTRRRLGLRRHFKLREPAGSWVEVYLAGKDAELYTTPLPNHELLVAALYEASHHPGTPTEIFERMVAGQPTLADRLQGAETLSPLLGAGPFDVGPTDGSIPGFVLLGDAAGFIDPITGGGMAQALLTAELLAAQAQALIEDGKAIHFARFEHDRARLLRDYRWLTRMVLLLAARPEVTPHVIRMLDRFPPAFSYLLGVSSGLRGLPWP